jgi:hypothetical protein
MVNRYDIIIAGSDSGDSVGEQRVDVVRYHIKDVGFPNPIASGDLISFDNKESYQVENVLHTREKSTLLMEKLDLKEWMRKHNLERLARLEESLKTGNFCFDVERRHN